MSTSETSPDFIDLPPLIPRARPQMEEPYARPTGGDMRWNVLTVVVLLGMASVILGIVSLINNPYSTFNPFQPSVPTLVMSVVIPTEVCTPTLPATATLPPEVTQEPGGGPVTPLPTFTATPLPTETATPGPSPTPTIFSIFPFIQRGDNKIIDASSFHDHDNCKLWVAGQAFDIKGAPLTGVTVMLGGYLERKTVSQLSLTGTALQYGPAGYEFTIGEQLAESHQSVWVQLFDQSMIPLSARILFDTTADCTQNLILVNFRQVK